MGLWLKFKKDVCGWNGDRLFSPFFFSPGFFLVRGFLNFESIISQNDVKLTWDKHRGLEM